MTQGALEPVACFDYGVAAKPLAGETLSGDGARADFIGEFELNGSPQDVAMRILSRCASGKDDALVLTVRYRGNGL